MNEGPRQIAAVAFDVSYSAGEPRKGERNTFNSFGLRGRGQLVVDQEHLHFVGETGRGSDTPRIRRDKVANVDYNPDNSGFVIRTSHNQDFMVLWVATREQAEALWALLPQEKSPDFVAEREQVNMRLAAYLLAVQRVADATAMRGLYP